MSIADVPLLDHLAEGTLRASLRAELLDPTTNEARLRVALDRVWGERTRHHLLVLACCWNRAMKHRRCYLGYYQGMARVVEGRVSFCVRGLPLGASIRFFEASPRECGDSRVWVRMLESFERMISRVYGPMGSYQQVPTRLTVSVCHTADGAELTTMTFEMARRFAVAQFVEHAPLWLFGGMESYSDM